MPLRRTRWRGLDVTIENEVGSYREWKRPDGTIGRTFMRFPYGFFSDHAGSDGDELDCYIGSDLASRFVYVVHQLTPDGKRDEDKCFLDFRDEASAKAAFLAHRDDGDRAYGGMSSIPADTFIAKLQRRTGDGKIRHSRMHLFSIPAFRFSLDTAIGKWSRIATMGEKSKDGARMTFNAETLGEMVENAEARGDKIAINADHASAYPETREAPALGFFGALAVVEGGKVVKAWGGQPDVAGLADGLYGRLDEITPRGADPLVGLANFKFTSPMFTTDGEAEDGSSIGFSLFDVAVTNTPFQSGCEIQMHRTSGAHALAKDLSGIVAGMWAKLSDGKWYEVARVFGNGVDVKTTAGVIPINADHVLDVDRIARGEKGTSIAWMSATPSSNGAHVMANVTPAQESIIRDANELKRQASAIDYEIGGKVATEISRGWSGGNFADSLLTAANMMEGVRALPGYRDEDDVRAAKDIARKLRSLAERASAARFSASTSGARRFSNGAPMNPDMMKKLGLAEDASDADKLAAVCSYAADLETKMGDLEIVHKDDDDKEEIEAMKALASEVGVDDGPKKMSRTLVAFRAKFAPQSEIASLKGEVVRLSKTIADREAAETEAKLVAFADSAIADGRWDKDKRPQLVAFARADMKAASESLAPKGTYTLLGRVAGTLDNRVAPAVNTDGKRGVAFSAKVKERMATTKEKYEVAAAHVEKAHPDLAREAAGLE